MSCSLGSAVGHNQRPFVEFYQFACPHILRNKSFSLKLTAMHTRAFTNDIGFDRDSRIKLTSIEKSNQGWFNTRVDMLRQRLREQDIPDWRQK